MMLGWDGWIWIIIMIIMRRRIIVTGGILTPETGIMITGIRFLCLIRTRIRWFILPPRARSRGPD